MNTCTILFPRHEPGISDTGGCLRQYAHFGPHVFRNANGKLIAWEDDYSCKCGCWDEEDYADVCGVYREVDMIEVPDNLLNEN
jgi:hypothetical protein